MVDTRVPRGRCATAEGPPFTTGSGPGAMRNAAMLRSRPVLLSVGLRCWSAGRARCTCEPPLPSRVPSVPQPARGHTSGTIAPYHTADRPCGPSMQPVVHGAAVHASHRSAHGPPLTVTIRSSLPQCHARIAHKHMPRHPPPWCRASSLTTRHHACARAALHCANTIQSQRAETTVCHTSPPMDHRMYAMRPTHNHDCMCRTWLGQPSPYHSHAAHQLLSARRRRCPNRVSASPTHQSFAMPRTCCTMT